MPVRIKRILVATDFSSSAHRAVSAAADWARRQQAQLRIIHVTPPDRWFSGARTDAAETAAVIQQHAANALKRVADEADPARKLDLSTGLHIGPAARSILGAAQDFRADLLFIGARGEREGLSHSAGLGGTSDKLLRTATVPLMLMRRSPGHSKPRIVAGVDLSSYSSRVLEWARIAAADGSLHAFHAYEVPFATRLQTYGLSQGAINVYTEEEQRRREADLAALLPPTESSTPISRAVERGEPVGLLNRYIQAVDASLVVLGKHVRGAHHTGSGSVGSVCHYIASFTPIDVLVVPPEDR